MGLASLGVTQAIQLTPSTPSPNEDSTSTSESSSENLSSSGLPPSTLPDEALASLEKEKLEAVPESSKLEASQSNPSLETSSKDGLTSENSSPTHKTASETESLKDGVSSTSKKHTSSTLHSDPNELPELDAETAKERVLEGMAMVWLAKRFGEVAKEAFNPPRAFSKIPQEAHMTVMFGGAIDFTGMLVAMFRKFRPEDWEASGGFSRLAARLEAKSDEYLARIKHEETKQARKVAAAMAAPSKKAAEAPVVPAGAV